MTELWEGWAFPGALPLGGVGVASEEQSQVSGEEPLVVTAKAYS